MTYFLAMLFLAQGVKHRCHNVAKHPKCNMVEVLNLNENQQKEWNKIEISFDREMIKLKTKLQNTNIDLKEILLSQEPDVNKIKKRMEEIANIEYQMRLKKIEKKIKLYKILSKEQREKFLPCLLGRNIHKRHSMRQEMRNRMSH